MKRVLRDYLTVVQILILFIGATFIILYATMFRNVWWGITLSTLGTAVISATLLSLLHGALGIDLPSVLEQRLKLNQNIYDMGLVDIHPQLGNEMIFDRFARATSIDLLYVSGKNTTHRHLNSMERALVDRGCQVRILICDSESLVLTNKSLANSLCPSVDLRAEVKEVSNQIRVLIDKLRKSEQPPQLGSIEVRFYKAIPTSSIIIVDREIARFTPYLPYTLSSSAPSYDVSAERGGKLFTAYQTAFNTLWDNTPRGLIAADFSFRPAPDSPARSNPSTASAS